VKFHRVDAASVGILDGFNTESDTKSSKKGMNARAVFSRAHVCWRTHITLLFYIIFFYIVQNLNNINKYTRNNTTVVALALLN